MRRRKRRRFPLIRGLFFLSALGGVLYTVQQISGVSDEQPAVIEIAESEAVMESHPPVVQAADDFRENLVEFSAPFIDLKSVHSPNVILTNLETGRVVTKRDSDKQLPPASLTKIMTVLVALENVKDLDQIVEMKPEYFDRLFEQEAAVAGFQVGEKVSFRDLLYGAMLPSGADACLAIAHLIAGSEAEYAILMNERAAELQMDATHFVTVTGLHHPDHVSSVADLELLLEVALENETFYQIFTTDEYLTGPTTFNPEGLTMRSTVKRYREEYEEIEKIIIGGKTGFTEEAGQCLATLAKVEGQTYLLVTAGAGAQAAGPGPDYVPILKPLHVLDAATIYKQLEKD